MWHTIVNPKTGRKVSVTGKIGKKILRNYISHLNGGAGPKKEKIKTTSLQWPACV